MLLEDLLALPVGARVLGKIEVPAMVSGVVVSIGNQFRLIRWDDGHSTIPFGNNLRADEYIAAHTELEPARQQKMPIGETNTELHFAVTPPERKDHDCT